MESLVAAARAVRANAYAPYSVYQVGAALLGSDGVVYTGCNVENVSFGATICAERTAVVKMVSYGCRAWTSLVVATKDGGTPCGVCLQVLAEFLAVGELGSVTWVDDVAVKGQAPFRDLLPRAFTTSGLTKQ